MKISGEEIESKDQVIMEKPIPNGIIRLFLLAKLKLFL